VPDCLTLGRSRTLPELTTNKEEASTPDVRTLAQQPKGDVQLGKHREGKLILACQISQGPFTFGLAKLLWLI